MVIDMNEAQVRTLEQVRQVVAGTAELEFKRADNDEGRYGWIGSVLQRFGYRSLKRPDRGVLLVYLQRLSGYSRAQVKRLVAVWVSGAPLVKRYCAPEHAFARRYTAADVALLAEVDRAMNTLSGPATACVLRRQRDVFADPRFERLGSISVGHLYNLRASAGYRAQRVVLTKTRPTKAATIGLRKAPAPEGRPGFGLTPIPRTPQDLVLSTMVARRGRWRSWPQGYPRGLPVDKPTGPSQAPEAACPQVRSTPWVTRLRRHGVGWPRVPSRSSLATSGRCRCGAGAGCTSPRSR